MRCATLESGHSRAEEAVEGAGAPVVFPGEAWLVSTPQAQGIAPGSVARAIEHLRTVCGKDGTRRTMIIRNGYVIWQGPDTHERRVVWSCTKSFMSCCLGLLWDDGRCAPDDLAWRYYPPLRRKYSQVTLKHLATFTSGYDSGDDPLDIADPQFEPGQKFRYSRQSDLLAAILTRLAGQSLEQLFFERIARPIGINDQDLAWGELARVDGLTINGGAGVPPSGLEISAAAMGRFGWLMCNGGVWDDQRLLSRRYVEYATVPRTSVSTTPLDPKAWYAQLPGNYGLNWWTNGPRPDGRRHWPHATRRTFAAQGHYNNICFVIPEWRMVIVRLGLDKVIDMRKYDRIFELLRAGIDDPGPTP